MTSDTPKVFAIKVVIRARVVENGLLLQQEPLGSIRSLADRDNIQQACLTLSTPSRRTSYMALRTHGMGPRS